MARSKPNRTLLLSSMAEHVLANGLNTASLRPLAAAAGTSDRMLIYHFGSKDALIAELLQFLATQMALGLDAALPVARMPTHAALVRDVAALLRSEPFRPYMRVWFDILSAAAQGQPAHHKAAQAILRIFLNWIALRHPDGHDGAPAALTLIEGILVMDAAGCSAIADQAVDALSSD